MCVFYLFLWCLNLTHIKIKIIVILSETKRPETDVNVIHFADICSLISVLDSLKTQPHDKDPKGLEIQ